MKMHFYDDWWHINTTLHKVDRQRVVFKLEGIQLEVCKTLWSNCSWDNKQSHGPNNNWKNVRSYKAGFGDNGGKGGKGY